MRSGMTIKDGLERHKKSPRLELNLGLFLFYAPTLWLFGQLIGVGSMPSNYLVKIILRRAWKLFACSS